MELVGAGPSVNRHRNMKHGRREVPVLGDRLCRFVRKRAYLPWSVQWLPWSCPRPPVGNASQGTLHPPLFDLSHGRAVLGTIDLGRELDPAVLRFVHHEVEMGCPLPSLRLVFLKQAILTVGLYTLNQRCPVTFDVARPAHSKPGPVLLSPFTTRERQNSAYLESEAAIHGLWEIAKRAQSHKETEPACLHGASDRNRTRNRLITNQMLYR